MNIPIYNGNPTFTTGSTPFGFYDNDTDFQLDAVRVAKFCANRLGYPLVDIELQSGSFFTAFEEAITKYGNEIYAYKIRQDFLDLEGNSTGSSLNNALIRPNLGNLLRISDQYAVEVGTGGDLTWYTGSIRLQEGVQDYDLNQWALEHGLQNQDIEFKRLFHSQKPASVRYLDPYLGVGGGFQNVLNDFGWGNYGVANQATLYPIYFDVQKIQEIEMNDTIRRSQLSFEIANNMLRIFPIPDHGSHNMHLWFDYILKSERSNPIAMSGSNKITNVSNVPFNNPTYSQINSIGRSWIFEYTLAVCKEMLGYVRGKYSTIPIPNSEISLNQGDLITAATSEKEALIAKLKLFLEETSREKILERKSLETISRVQELQQVPFLIYMG
jgi:hypothetical protein